MVTKLNTLNPLKLQDLGEDIDVGEKKLDEESDEESDKESEEEEDEEGEDYLE